MDIRWDAGLNLVAVLMVDAWGVLVLVTQRFARRAGIEEFYDV